MRVKVSIIFFIISLLESGLLPAHPTAHFSKDDEIKVAPVFIQNAIAPDVDFFWKNICVITQNSEVVQGVDSRYNSGQVLPAIQGLQELERGVFKFIVRISVSRISDFLF